MTAPDFIIVAIDGGAATGKSSTSRNLAARLNFMHVDTGAHYRSITHALLQNGAILEEPTKTQEILKKLTIETQVRKQMARLVINGSVPDETEIRSPEVNASVSQFAAQPAVRDFLFQYQREQAELARKRSFSGLIMEGRDIGSIIFPEADFRFFLHADAETRAKRRAKEGLSDSILTRDKMDASRKTAPLVCPQGAIQIDTGPLTLEGVVELLCQQIKRLHD
jgi:cytidylate kinase